MFRKIIGISIFLILNSGYAVDVGIALDTVCVTTEDYHIQLRNDFILEPLLRVTFSHKETPDFTLNKIQGMIEFEKPDSAYTCIIKYRYLIKKPPLVIGPKALQLPKLESILDGDLDTPQPEIVRGQKTEAKLVSTGSIFRSIEISPFGGADFTGGLQLQLQGKLTDDVEVTGVLSDQNLNIQPEGTTQSLDEIDKIYLKVGHPHFEILAGDIVYKNKTGTLFAIDRKLNGMMGTYHKNSLKSSAVFAKSEGKYHKLLFNGTEGKQGPYYLTSIEGSRNIIVQAGTEKVWIDGERLIRGENKDYKIDYSLGEMTFTPKQLIHFDSEIFVEYQYSDFQYNQQIAGSTIEYSIDDKKEFQISWFHEHDVFTDKTSGLTSAQMDSLKISGDLPTKISGAVENEEGDYILTDSVFVYAPGSDEIKYNVQFYQDQVSGTYKRTVNQNGVIVFEFIPENERELLIGNLDLYTPNKLLLAPKGLDLIQSRFSWDTNQFGHLELESAVSRFDKNRVSNLNDNDNSGFAHLIRYRSQDITLPGDVKMAVELSNRRKENRYQSIQRDKSVTYGSDWNIETTEGLSENELSGTIAMVSDSLGGINLAWNHLALGKMNYERLNSGVVLHLNHIPELTLLVNQVNTNDWTFTQRAGEVLFLNGNFHPFLSYKDEKITNKERFDHAKGGIQWESSAGSLSLGMGKRNDWVQSSRDSLIKTHAGTFGELDWESKTGNGWRQNIVFRQRVLSNFENNVNQSYSLWRINMGYFVPKKPVQWDLKAKLEETFIENRAVVYDSVGAGLGTHRYDTDLQEYIPDPNGSFIAYTVLTGDRMPSTHLNGTQKLIFHMRHSRWEFLRSFIFRFTGVMDFQGQQLGYKYLFTPNISDSYTTQSKWLIRQETSYDPRGTSRKIRQRYQLLHHLNGLDPRGKDLRIEKELEMDLYEPLSKNIQAKIQMDLNWFDVISEISEFRNRNGTGIWFETGMKYNSRSNQQVDIYFLAGNSDGKLHQNKFNAYSYGLQCNVSWFFSKSKRVQIFTEWNQVNEKNGLETIPPEVLNGLPVGKSFRSTVQTNFILGDYWSVNTSLNYIHDQRYNHFVTMTGELRVLL